MSKVIYSFSVGNQTVIVLDKIEKDFKKVEIDGEIYNVLPAYDIENAIVINSKKDFSDKTVNLI